MAREQVIEKLNKKFENFPNSEEDLIYILSKVRKVIELDRSRDKFAKLEFYCNFALHAKIDRKLPDVVTESFKRLKEGRDYSSTMIGFGDFHDELQKFMSAHNLPNFYQNSTSEERWRLFEILLGIYADTPIFFEMDKQYKLVVTNSGDRTMSINFSPVDS